MNKELNEKLYRELYREHIDFEIISNLLDEGANPIGPLESDEESCVLEELFCEADYYYRKELYDNLPRIVDLFIEKGLDPKDIEANEDDPNPLWCLAFICSKNAMIVLKTLIENGLNKDSVMDFVEHFLDDVSGVWCGPLDDEFISNFVVYGLKMIMLSASYKQILDNNDYLQKLIEVENNEYDLTKFRNYEQYEIAIDTSTGVNVNNDLAGATISIIENETNRIVWKFTI